MRTPKRGAPDGSYRTGQRSRERFVTATAELLQTHGYYGTSLNEILARSGAPRGSLYYYFPGGKDELTVEALRSAGAAVGDMLNTVLETAPDSRAALRSIFNFFREELLRSNYLKGCPIAAIAQEVGPDHEHIRRACDAIYEEWEGRLVTLLMGRPESGDLEREADSEVARRAKLILGMLEGALLLAKSRRDGSYLDLTRDHVLEMVR